MFACSLRAPGRPTRTYQLQAPPMRPQFRRFAASGERHELRRVAVRRMGWRRTTRFFEPQLQRPILQDSSPAQSSPQFSAPCPPHCGSASAPPHFAVARWDFISILLSQNE